MDVPYDDKVKIKLDYGWKTLLRGMRICLRTAMDKSDMYEGRHHWSDTRLFERTRLFVEQYLNFKNSTDKEVWSIVLLMNPAKGI